MKGSALDMDLLDERLPDDIIVVTLNRPHAKNAVSFEMWERFSDILDQAERGTPPRALIITGAEMFFSAGGDVKVPPVRGDGALSNAARLEMGHRIIQRLRSLPVPTIAAIEGRAIGIGWSLVLACDLIIAADDAEFSAPFVRLGMVPDGGISWLLVKRVGRHRAAEILLSGRAVSAHEAFGLGLVSLVAERKTALAAAIDFAKSIAGPSRHAAELTKRSIQHAEVGDLAGALAAEAAYFHLVRREATKPTEKGG